MKPDTPNVEEGANAKTCNGGVVIDVDGCDVGEDVDGIAKSSGASSKEEKMCRICLVSHDSGAIHVKDLIQLGCKCKNDLGTAHRSCAETWFATKENRYCEICGAVAINVTGVRDSGFILEQNEPLRTPYSCISVDRRYQPICAFILAVIVMVFLVRWLIQDIPHREPS